MDPPGISVSRLGVRVVDDSPSNMHNFHLSRFIHSGYDILQSESFVSACRQIGALLQSIYYISLEGNTRSVAPWNWSDRKSMSYVRLKLSEETVLRHDCSRVLTFPNGGQNPW